MTSVMPPGTQRVIEGHGLVLRGWDDELIPLMARWGQRGFPYHAFDLGHLSDPFRRTSTLARYRDESRHRHYVACEDGMPVGRVSLNPQDATGLYLWSVHVPPEHGGRGVCRRMLAALMESCEEEFPGKAFALTTNAFAENAHRVYRDLGFQSMESRWHHDREIAELLWRVTPSEREPISRHIRFHNGRWEVRVYVMKREAGARMRLHPLVAAG